MTDRQRIALLRAAERELKLTKDGYDAEAGHWKRAFASLDKLESDLEHDPVPLLGPVWIGGKSILLHDLTHATSGIPLYPAFDDAFNQGRVIVAPELLTVVTPRTSSNPGEAFYALGKSKLRYWFGHLDRSHLPGTKFAKGDAVGKVAVNTIGGGPHVHVGINVELLLGAGKQLAHHTNYTHGSPTVGAQLAKSLS